MSGGEALKALRRANWALDAITGAVPYKGDIEEARAAQADCRAAIKALEAGPASPASPDRERVRYNTDDMLGWVYDTLALHKVQLKLHHDLAAHLVKSFETTVRVTDIASPDREGLRETVAKVVRETVSRTRNLRTYAAHARQAQAETIRAEAVEELLSLFPPLSEGGVHPGGEATADAACVAEATTLVPGEEQS